MRALDSDWDIAPSPLLLELPLFELQPALTRRQQYRIGWIEFAKILIGTQNISPKLITHRKQKRNDFLIGTEIAFFDSCFAAPSFSPRPALDSFVVD